MKRYYWVLTVILFVVSYDAMIHGQNIKNENEMIQVFKKITLKKDDFSESLEKINERFIPLIWPNYGFIGKPEISTKDDKIQYFQEISLKDGTDIRTDYMLLDTPEDAMKANNYLTSGSAWTAYVLSIRTKEELGLEKFASAFYYDQSNVYALRFQCKKWLISVSIHGNKESKNNESKNKIMQMCRHLAKTIIKRISIAEMEGSVEH